MGRLLTLLLFCHCSLLLGQDKLPNIVLILTDDAGYSDLGCYGGEIRTPNLDSLGYNGLRFTNCYNNAKCSPTRASLLTGQYPQKVGAGDLCRIQNETDLPGYLGYLNPEFPTLAEMLQDAGYLTLLSGKWHLGGEHVEIGKTHQGYPKPRSSEYAKWPTERGFHHFFGLIHGSSGPRVPWADRPYRLNKNVLNTHALSRDFWATEAYTDFALDFLHFARDTTKAPFFLYLPHTAPHKPLEAPQEMVDKYLCEYESMNEWVEVRNRRYQRMEQMGFIPREWEMNESYRYPVFRDEEKAGDLKTRNNIAKEMATHAAMMEQVDQQVGRVVQHLKKLGEFDNTIIIYMSDNGADGRGISDFFNTPFYGTKTSLREAGIRTPLIIHWPKGMTDQLKQTITDQWVHVVDFVPTFLELVSKEYPKENEATLPGNSLLSFLQTGNKIEQEYLFWDLYGEKAVTYQERWKWYQNRKKKHFLFDLESDGTETINLALECPELIEELQAKHAQFCKANNVVAHRQVVKARQTNKWNLEYPSN